MLRAVSSGLVPRRRGATRHWSRCPMRRIPTARALSPLLAALLANPLVAQKPKRSVVRPDSTRQTSSAAADPALRALHWRLVGPFRGGRVTAVAGDLVHPLVFYF